jgi:hypothetical protein
MTASNWTIETLVDGTRMFFDAADKRNGSLYVCDVGGGLAGSALIGSLREAGLWSAAEPKVIADEQKAAYKAGLQFVEACEYTIAGKRAVLLRCDHPKFPSDAARFGEWQAVASSLSKQGS